MLFRFNFRNSFSVFICIVYTHMCIYLYVYVCIYIYIYCMIVGFSFSDICLCVVLFRSVVRVQLLACLLRRDLGDGRPPRNEIQWVKRTHGLRFRRRFNKWNDQIRNECRDLVCNIICVLFCLGALLMLSIIVIAYAFCDYMCRVLVMLCFLRRDLGAGRRGSRGWEWQLPDERAEHISM